MPHLPWMWYVLGAMAAWYFVDATARGATRGPVPSPCRAPAALLVRGAKVLWRLWPLVLLIMASAVVNRAEGHAEMAARQRAEASAGQAARVDPAEPTRPPFGEYLGSLFSGTYAEFLVVMVFRVDSPEVHDLLLIVAIGLWAWIALWDPWKLGKWPRILCAAGAVCGAIMVAWEAADLVWQLGPPEKVPPSWLMLALAPATFAADALFGAAVAGIVWHAVQPGKMRAEAVARTAMRILPTWLVMTVVEGVFDLSFALVSRHGPHEVLGVQGGLMAVTMLPLFLLAWAPWIAAGGGGSVVRCVLGAPRLILKAPGLFAVLVLRLSVLAVATEAAEWALQWLLIGTGAAHYANAAVTAAVYFWFAVTALFAYRSFALEVKLMRHYWYEPAYWDRLRRRTEAA